MKTCEEDLAHAAAGGDREAFGALLSRVYDRMFGLAFKLTGNRAEAEDLVQDVCAALPAKLANFRGDAKVTTWLYRIVVNASRDRHRRRISHAKAATGWGDWEVSRRADEVEAQERADWLRLAMDALTPPELRETLVLVLEGLNHAQVAEILGVSEGTISWRMSQAKKKLKAMKEAEA
ncbi:MAG: RNA polymerase sigma factor [Pelagimonas sp.]|uniref:RNA polymerase sigma factor n=1 Tax=Pelagimonas sp. TaxID=2073170 RepID=UPI003D6A351C